MIKGIKKILFLSVALTIILSPLAALAALINNLPSINNVPTNINTVLTNIISGVIGFIALVAVLFLVWGGVQYLTSGGEETLTENAKKTITYAIMGLFIAAIAYAAVTLITGWLV